MEENLDEFMHFRAELGGKRAFKKYIRSIFNGEEMGDHIEIEIIQRVTDRPIVIIQSGANPILPDNINQYGGEPIFIYYTPPAQPDTGLVGHYDTFILGDSVDPGTILAAIRANMNDGQLVDFTNPMERKSEEVSARKSSGVYSPRM